MIMRTPLFPHHDVTVYMGWVFVTECVFWALLASERKLMIDHVERNVHHELRTPLSVVHG